MLYHDLKQINFIEKINQVVPIVRSLIYQMMWFFLNIFYRHSTKISMIETAVIGQNHRSGGPSKTNKN